MKLFHISDVLSVTTGRLVASRHMEGVYDILDFLTGDQLFTHQLPRAERECTPWMRSQFPRLFPEEPIIAQALLDLDALMTEGDTREERGAKIDQRVERLRLALELPEMLPVYEMGADMHTHIDPFEEAQAMMGDDRVIVVETEQKRRNGCDE
jgi:hypothetical protein